MSLNMLHKGAHVRIGPARFLILKKLDGTIWQLENTVTGEWRRLAEEDLLDRYARHELVFDGGIENRQTSNGTSQLDRSLSGYPPELIAVVQNRVQYLKEIDRQQPIAITSKTVEPLICSVSERINDANPPGWRTLARDYRKWLNAGRDVRAIIFRYSDRGGRTPRLLPEVKSVIDEVIAGIVYDCRTEASSRNPPGNSSSPCRFKMMSLVARTAIFPRPCGRTPSG